MEYFDVYDANKKLTGKKVPRKGARLEDGHYQLIVLAIIEDMTGNILITKRALDKKWAPGAWEVPGGGVMAGESSLEGVIREVREEVGLDISKANPTCIYTYSNEDLERGDNYFVDIYHARLDFNLEDVVLEEKESIGCDLVTFAKCKEYDQAGDFLHYKRLLSALKAKENIQY